MLLLRALLAILLLQSSIGTYWCCCYVHYWPYCCYNHLLERIDVVVTCTIGHIVVTIIYWNVLTLLLRALLAILLLQSFIGTYWRCCYVQYWPYCCYNHLLERIDVVVTCNIGHIVVTIIYWNVLTLLLLALLAILLLQSFIGTYWRCCYLQYWPYCCYNHLLERIDVVVTCTIGHIVVTIIYWNVLTLLLLAILAILLLQSFIGTYWRCCYLHYWPYCCYNHLLERIDVVVTCTIGHIVVTIIYWNVLMLLLRAILAILLLQSFIGTYWRCCYLQYWPYCCYNHLLERIDVVVTCNIGHIVVTIIYWNVLTLLLRALLAILLLQSSIGTYWRCCYVHYWPYCCYNHLLERIDVVVTCTIGHIVGTCIYWNVLTLLLLAILAILLLQSFIGTYWRCCYLHYWPYCCYNHLLERIDVVVTCNIGHIVVTIIYWNVLTLLLRALLAILLLQSFIGTYWRCCYLQYWPYCCYNHLLERIDVVVTCTIGHIVVTIIYWNVLTLLLRALLAILLLQSSIGTYWCCCYVHYWPYCCYNHLLERIDVVVTCNIGHINVTIIYWNVLTLLLLALLAILLLQSSIGTYWCCCYVHYWPYCCYNHLLERIDVVATCTIGHIVVTCIYWNVLTLLLLAILAILLLQSSIGTYWRCCYVHYWPYCCYNHLLERIDVVATCTIGHIVVTIIYWNVLTLLLLAILAILLLQSFIGTYWRCCYVQYWPYCCYNHLLERIDVVVTCTIGHIVVTIIYWNVLTVLLRAILAILLLQSFIGTYWRCCYLHYWAYCCYNHLLERIDVVVTCNIGHIVVTIIYWNVLTLLLRELLAILLLQSFIGTYWRCCYVQYWPYCCYNHLLERIDVVVTCNIGHIIVTIIYWNVLTLQ